MPVINTLALAVNATKLNIVSFLNANVPECGQVPISWSGGIPPYYLAVDIGVSTDPYEMYGPLNGTSYIWDAGITDGNQVHLAVMDSTTAIVTTPSFTILPGNGYCESFSTLISVTSTTASAIMTSSQGSPVILPSASGSGSSRIPFRSATAHPAPVSLNPTFNPVAASGTTSVASSPSPTVTVAATRQISQPPIGAIIGGAIGGLAVICVIMTILYRCRHKSRDADRIRNTRLVGAFDRSTIGMAPSGTRQSHKHIGHTTSHDRRISSFAGSASGAFGASTVASSSTAGARCNESGAKSPTLGILHREELSLQMRSREKQMIDLQCRGSQNALDAAGEMLDVIEIEKERGEENGHDSLRQKVEFLRIEVERLRIAASALDSPPPSYGASGR